MLVRRADRWVLTTVGPVQRLVDRKEMNAGQIVDPLRETRVVGGREENKKEIRRNRWALAR